uniref:Myosin-51-like n=1 Tax=Dermatophagoides pteronyssinus TaxID=6956 RepID=A0A6P6Y9W1_DERPT|nr:myosin-51-like [Dermatophagoides pteronyssinus]
MTTKALFNMFAENRSQSIIINGESGSAYFIRDTLAQILYQYLFEFIVYKINKRFSSGNVTMNEYPFFGILDIFGFEIFTKNSLEQLCINYTNERLQDIFNEQVNRYEETLYLNENSRSKITAFLLSQTYVRMGLSTSPITKQSVEVLSRESRSLVLHKIKLEQYYEALNEVKTAGYFGSKTNT